MRQSVPPPEKEEEEEQQQENEEEEEEKPANRSRRKVTPTTLNGGASAMAGGGRVPRNGGADAGAPLSGDIQSFKTRHSLLLPENEEEEQEGEEERSSHRSRRKVAPTTAGGGGGGGGRVLRNGDVYKGGLWRSRPHGWGRYAWADGCVYEGEWRRGKATGKGRFSWPSGAVYDGDFVSGRMEGAGVFSGPAGNIYRGGWSDNRRHGYGEKRYANGDVYEGWWHSDLQHGGGRYLWRNGNQFAGNWSSGVVSGEGFFALAEEGAAAAGERGSAAAGESWRGFSGICIWDSEGAAGDIICDIVEDSEGFRQLRPAAGVLSGEERRQGRVIRKGERNYELMLNLQLGIRHMVGRQGGMEWEVREGDFDPREKYWTRFPPEGSKTTPPHTMPEFRWKDYCPLVFRRLRGIFQVDPAEYMLGICGDDALRELSSPGKSGSFFYLTQDERFLIKTVKKSEVKVLVRMLASYYQHVCMFENSLVTKFYGVHCIKPIGGPKTRFVVMGNLFCSAYRIHRRFDLKGSSHGRMTEKTESEIDETTTLKDLDLDLLFRLRPAWFEQFMRQIDHDCGFLEAERIMDYSLLVGLHFRDESTGEKIGLSPFLLRSGTGGGGTYQNEKFMRGCRFLEAELQDMDRVISGWKPLIRLGANMPARAEKVGRRSDVGQYGAGGRMAGGGGEVYDVILYFGIIDILQDYDISKRIEHAYKSLQADPFSISAVDPKLYSKRFRDFIRRVFVEDR